MSVKLVLASQSEYVSGSKTGGYSMFDSFVSMLFVCIGFASAAELFSMIGPFKLLLPLGLWLPNSIGENASWSIIWSEFLRPKIARCNRGEPNSRFSFAVLFDGNDNFVKYDALRSMDVLRSSPPF